MKKENNFWVIAILLLAVFLAGCKSISGAANATKDQVQQLADQAAHVTTPIIIGEGNNTQIILPPAVQQPQQQFQSSDVLNPSYIAPCWLQKYSVLNWYCSGKTFWSQESTILSWHIPYSIVAFFALVLILAIVGYFIYKLIGRN